MQIEGWVSSWSEHKNSATLMSKYDSHPPEVYCSVSKWLKHFQRWKLIWHWYEKGGKLTYLVCIIGLLSYVRTESRYGDHLWWDFKFKSQLLHTASSRGGSYNIFHVRDAGILLKIYFDLLIYSWLEYIQPLASSNGDIPVMSWCIFS